MKGKIGRSAARPANFMAAAKKNDAKPMKCGGKVKKMKKGGKCC